MLGCLAFQLLTGAPPFYPGRAVPYNIVSMAVALGEETDTLRDDWYTYDTRMRKLAEVPPEPIRRNKAYVPAIESALREVLNEDESRGRYILYQSVPLPKPRQAYFGERCLESPLAIESKCLHVRLLLQERDMWASLEPAVSRNHTEQFRVLDP
ncbi:hypothetical protein FA13DRAFT_1057208 [Coprinellus micaceus]|uniref:Protein kinase domain-containing protein n=1 Tax=Coprinellus micaceus TaxID=71717 RepID=A0A4Y7RNC7_COPMI|nr:hypothetical protein FA13DRAFT_1057208 [Coprinellus micaceus]